MDFSKRLISLDILRGLTIAGMIIVNDPGSWQYVYPPLRHAPWHGITPTDFVFPFFLFIVGVSVVLAYTKRMKSNVAQGPMIRKILVRTAMIFGMGVYMSISTEAYGHKVFQVLLGILILFGFSDLQQTHNKEGLPWRKVIIGALILAGLIGFLSVLPEISVRIPGVLQRIALVFLVCALLFLKTRWRTQAIVGGVLLLGYWLVMAFLPVPIDEVIREALATGEVARAHSKVAVEGLKQVGEGFIAGNFEPGVNLQAWLDRLLVPGRIYENTWDPEGLLSTLPAIGSGITGMMAGHLVLNPSKKDVKVNHLFLLGFCMLLVGNVWDWFFPFNKNLWSSSFVLYTSGLSALTLAALYWFVDVKERGTNNPLFTMGKVFGANAITAYVLHSLFARLNTPVKDWIMDLLMGWGMSGELASLCFAVDYTLFIYLIVWVMYKRKVFLKW